MPRCAWCADPLRKPPRGPFPRFCCAACRVEGHHDARPDLWAANRRRQAEAALKPRVSMTCPYCAGAYETARPTMARHCGTLICRRAHQAAMIRPYLHERRARIRGSRVERFTELDIFERDGWTCGICDGPVDPNVRFPAPGTASLDHVLPISRGGGHTRDNVRCSHLGCNLQRGNRVETLHAA